ncbi:MAG: aldo/keto reductase [Acetobacteraceae bacterium]|nr:aldo/keto reductase [Acetobacteraceae bacterium]
MPELRPGLGTIGQGTWHMGEDRSRRAAEIAALRLGLDLGMTLIDTAEMYAEGGAEEVVGEAIAGRRDEVFLVSKIYPHNASHSGVAAACARSLRRLKVNCLDLYLLHWPGSTPLHETVEAFERLKDAGKIRAWGVSNFDLDAMRKMPPGCATNQVLYNLGERGIEYDLLPWSREHGMPVMAYSPVAQGGRLLANPALKAVAGRHGVTPAQVALAWTLREPGVLAIPKAADPAHVRQNAEAARLRLSEEDLRALDAAFPPPARKRPLAML